MALMVPGRRFKLPYVSTMALLVIALAALTGIAIIGTLAINGVGAGTESSAATAKVYDTDAKHEKFCKDSAAEYTRAVDAFTETPAFATAKDAYYASKIYSDAIAGKRVIDENVLAEVKSLEDEQKKYALIAADLARTKEERILAFQLVQQNAGEATARKTLPDVTPPKRIQYGPVSAIGTPEQWAALKRKFATNRPQ